MGKNRSMAMKVLKVKQEDSKRIKESAYNQMCGNPLPESLRPNLRNLPNYGTYNPSTSVLKEKQNNIASKVLNGTMSKAVAESLLQKMSSELSLLDCVARYLAETERRQTVKRIKIQELDHAI